MKLIIKTQSGLEELLAQELKNLEADNIEIGTRMVSCEGDLKLMYRINYESRLALKVLRPIVEFEIDSAKQLYEKAMECDWNEWVLPKQTFSIKFTVFSAFFQNSLYAAQLLKDAVVDRVRDKMGKRPSVDIQSADIVIDLHINEKSCSISMDSSGEPLFKRNYKNKVFRAPINEILAAGMIMLSDWDGKKTFINPMCGSGTLLWEALFIAENRPPQFYRKKFAFKNWKDYDRGLFAQIAELANEKIKEPAGRIIGLDNNQISMKMLRKNLRELELDTHISTQVIDFFDWTNNPENAIIIMNPPYDERLKVPDVKRFYSKIGDHLKRNFQNNTAWIITSNKEAMKAIGLKHSKKLTLFNGPLECRYLKYELFKGNLKDS